MVQAVVVAQGQVPAKDRARDQAVDLDQAQANHLEVALVPARAAGPVPEVAQVPAVDPDQEVAVAAVV
ncbi:MAG: hypothetical protein ACYC3X_23895 [Pirellulaceae bacterium]